MTKPTLTKRQSDILKHIARHIDANGYQPSIREIGERFGIRSPNGVVCHLQALQRKGVLRMNTQTARAIEFNWKGWL